MTNIKLDQIPGFSKIFSYDIPDEESISCCRVRFFSPQQSQQNQNKFLSWIKSPEIQPQIVLLTAVAENQGESLSNSIEFAIPQVLNKLEIESNSFDSQNCIIIEHYNQDAYSAYLDHEEDFETFHLVKICPKSIYPVWKSISADDLKAMIQCEFKPKNKRFFKSFLTKNWNPFSIFAALP